MTFRNKLARCALTAVLAAGLCPASALATPAPSADGPEFAMQEVVSGTCGANLTWTLDTATGALEIQGTGDMTSGYNNVPWGSYRDAIKTITIAEGVTSIGSSAFHGCTSLASVSIPSTVTSIGGSAFAGCTALASVDIPSSVTTIGGSAFSGCTSLAFVGIPEGVTRIGGHAFYDCTSLASVTIPASVTSIGYKAFQGCASLASFSVAENNTAYWSDGRALVTKSDVKIEESIATITVSAGTLAAYANASGANYAIPEGVTSIWHYAFQNCASLASVSIPEGVTSIGTCTFSGCTSLTSVIIPEGVTRIDELAFSSCTSLTSVSIPASAAKIDSCPFLHCPSLASIRVSAGNASYRSDGRALIAKADIVWLDHSQEAGTLLAYANASGENYAIPEGVTRIDGHAFYDCTSLASVTIPEGVTHMYDPAFHGCTSLASVRFAGDVPSYFADAFDGDTLTAYYPQGNATWEALLNDGQDHNYGGTITWVAYDPAPTPAFPDVSDPENQWFHDSVYAAVEKGLFSGYDDGTFGPGNALTRAQAAVVLWRWFNPDEAASYDAGTATDATGMADLAAGHAFYTGAANWAVANGVINGYADGTFGPSDPLTREQLCAVVANAAEKLKGADTSSNRSKLAAMPDATNVSGWAAAGVAWGLDKGIISGKQANGQRIVAPGDTVTRAEMAAITVNAINGEVL
ncbi:MAG: leucine-rich repeat protein [Coriobacteriia bacterium]|nr:leucine-rich repeat protein [Coriobacteriia bacterium]